MKELNKKKFIEALKSRIAANLNAVRLYFSTAGVPLGNDSEVTINDMINLMKTNYTVWSDCMRYLYKDAEQLINENPEHFGEVANADGEANQFDVLGLIGSTLAGAGSFLAGGNEDALVMQEAEHRTELAKQEAASSKRTLWIVLGILAVILIAAVFIFRKRF